MEIIKWKGIDITIFNDSVWHVEASLTNQIALLNKALEDDIEVVEQFMIESELLTHGDLTIDIEKWIAYGYKKQQIFLKELIVNYYINEIN